MKSVFVDQFTPADQQAWLTQVKKELTSDRNGALSYETLRWHTPDGFVTEPYYTADDLKSLPLDTIQSAQKQTVGWLNAPEYLVNDEKSDNAVLQQALACGANALVIRLTNQTNVSRLLNGIKLSNTPVFFRFSSTPPANLTEFVHTLKRVAPYQLKGGLLINAGEATAEVTRLTADSPQFRTICANGHLFHNAGATATQELAFMLASLADQYDQLTDAGLSIDQLIPKTTLSVSVGTSYFPEIAKLRALRVLVNRFLSAYLPAEKLASSYLVHAQTSTFYDAAATPNTNLLRATTEAMAAVIGGCDVLTVHPYNTVSGTSSERADQAFADRIARNLSILLSEESHLGKVADPSAGSYYIENQTHQLVEAAWNLFLSVENQGGFGKSFARGFVSVEIERAYQAKVDAVRAGRVLVGVTKFRFDEPHDQPRSVSETETEQLPNRRLAESFE